MTYPPQWQSEPDPKRPAVGPYPPQQNPYPQQASHPASPAGWPAAYPQSPAGYPQSPGAYQQPMYGPPPIVFAHTAPSSGSAVTALVLGIVGIFAGWCLLGLPSIGAIIFGHIGLSDTKDGSKSGRGMAVAGVALGYLLVVPTIALFFLFGAGFLGLAGAAGTAP